MNYMRWWRTDGFHLDSNGISGDGGQRSLECGRKRKRTGPRGSGRIRVRMSRNFGWQTPCRLRRSGQSGPQHGRSCSLIWICCVKQFHSELIKSQKCGDFRMASAPLSLFSYPNLPGFFQLCFYMFYMFFNI